jgi:hypothetical protein
VHMKDRRSTEHGDAHFVEKRLPSERAELREKVLCCVAALYSLRLSSTCRWCAASTSPKGRKQQR